MAAMEAFCRDVLGARIIYCDEDFAAIELLGSIFMVHADHSYLDNPVTGVITGAETRGAGIELRLYGADPHAVEKRAAALGHFVLAGSIDKPHGLRECYIVGPEVMSSCPVRGCKPESSISYSQTPGMATATEALRQICNTRSENPILTISG